jgi:hypothetical protein
MKWLRRRGIRTPRGWTLASYPTRLICCLPLTTRPPAATAVCLALSLAACQTPAVQTRTVEVKIPVAVQPIKPAQVPAVPAPLPSRPSSLSAAADVLASKWCEAVSYFLKADPLLRVSAGQQPNALPTYPECER